MLGERHRDRDIEAGCDLRVASFFLLTAEGAGLENPNAAKKAKGVGECAERFGRTWALRSYFPGETSLGEVATAHDRYHPLVALLERLGIAEELVKVLIAERASLPGEVKVEAAKVGLGFVWSGFVDYCKTLVAEQEAVSKSLNPESPVKPTRPAIEMTVDGVMTFMRYLQRKPESGGRPLNLDLPVHAQRELDIKLSGRDKGVRFIADAWREMHMSPVADRTKFKVMVCSGLSGLGKTRMLEEWRMLFDKAGVNGPRLGIMVLYFNGRGLRTMDRVLPAEASFSWRMLHRLFLDGNKDSLNGPALQTYFRQHLPENAKDLTLELALLTVLEVAKQNDILKDGERLSLFLGVDEYQKIPEVPLDAEMRTPLKRVLAELVNCNANIPNLRLYPMFAGTDWSKMSVARSSIEDTLRVPLQLLLSRDAEAAIASRPDLREYLASTLFRREVFFLGGVPRFFVEFSAKVSALGSAPRSEGIVSAAQRVWAERVIKAWEMDAPSYVKLVAHAVAGVGVLNDSVPGIGAHPRGENAQPLQHGFKWRHLADMGLCTLDEIEREKKSAKFTVGIPYCVVALASSLDEADVTTEAEKSLIQNLQWLCKHVDAVTYDLAPWQLWEKFGACFHAMRINALIIVHGNCGPFSFSLVCTGAAVNGCSDKVKLRHMRVMETDAKFGRELPNEVSEKDNGSNKVDWLQTGWVLLNGAGGIGVDIFFALPLANGLGHVVCADQRKREAGSLGEKRAAAQVEKARSRPRCLSEQSKLVVGLFSMFPSYEQGADDLPDDCFVVSFREHQAYHGCLTLHPASSPCVDVNRDNQSTLELLQNVNATLAKAVMARRDLHPFVDICDFKNFLKSKKVALSEVDEERVIVFGTFS